jgi:hypothetical protein
VQARHFDGTPATSWLATNIDGTYSAPNVFDDDFVGVICARVTYTDPGTNEEHKIINYPFNDPRRPMQGNETIVVPYPVVLQGGWGGGTQTWQKVGDKWFGQYLRVDPADDGTKTNGLDSVTSKLPAFITYTVPNNEQDPTYGYDNNVPETAEGHDRNAQELHGFITGPVYNSIRSFILTLPRGSYQSLS